MRKNICGRDLEPDLALSKIIFYKNMRLYIKWTFCWTFIQHIEVWFELRDEENYKVNVVGGDISGSYAGLVINITVIGFQNKKNIVYRDGAKKGDDAALGARFEKNILHGCCCVRVGSGVSAPLYSQF